MAKRTQIVPKWRSRALGLPTFFRSFDRVDDFTYQKNRLGECYAYFTIFRPGHSGRKPGYRPDDRPCIYGPNIIGRRSGTQIKRL